MGRKESSSGTSSSDEEEKATDDANLESWVQCDKCQKWRRIPTAMAEALRDDMPWYCEHNPNKALANCSVAQELTNEEIDAELGDDDGEEELDEGLEEERARRRRIPAVWQLIRDNFFTNRRRKQQEEDDVMICQCKPVWRGGDGCGPDCINRMLCIECVPGFCPCEDKCTNQVFTLKQYAKLEVRRAGAKGFGLFALEDIKKGQFIIEYIGEVLEEEEYLRRKDFYAEVGQRHYYFMNIGNGEVIDACRKGNRARFINHSCDPNCETQKWLARGELAIGLFATKDIACQEELTFDYNFERYGDKPMRCYCASRTCRKFIGGVQDTYDESMQLVDPDDASNDFQPIMLTDTEMDWATKALLDWRVGVPMDKEKEGLILARLERICKARGCPWQPGHFHGTQAVPSATKETEIADIADRMEEDDTRAQDDTKDEGGKEEGKATKKGRGGRMTAAQRRAKQEDKGMKAEEGAAAPRGPPKAAVKQLKVKEQTEAASPPLPPDRKQPMAVPKAEALAAARAGAARRRLQQTGAAKVEPATTTSTMASAAARRQQPAEPGPSSSALSAATQAANFSSYSEPPVSRRTKYSNASRQALRRRSEIDRRLDALINTSGRLKEAKRENIIKVLRMFNLCDIGPPRVAVRPLPPLPMVPAPPDPADDIKQVAVGEQADGQPAPSTTEGETQTAGVGASAAGGIKEEAGSEMQHSGVRPGSDALIRDDAAGPPPPAIVYALPTAGILASIRDPSLASQPVVIGPRQRARMADLSLLLDVILKTSSATVKKDFVACGVLNQLQQIIGRNFSKEYSVLLRKMLRVIESLPLTADDIHGVRTAHGTFYNVLQELAGNQDYDVRTKAAALAKKFPISACTDPMLLQGMRGRGPAAAAGPGSTPLPGLPPLPGADGKPRVMRPNMAGGTPADGQGRIPRTSSSEQVGVTDTAGGMGRGRAMHMRAGSSDHLGGVGRPGSPAMGPAGAGMAGPSPLGPYAASPAQGEGAEPGPEGEAKRGRKRGFTDGPEGADAGPGRPLVRLPAGVVPYSYRHGSALLPHSRAEPPPPPLDAEELFELLQVPLVLVEREAGYRNPVPTVLPAPPGPGDPADGVHGAGTDIEIVFAVGVYETDWVSAATAAHATRRERERRRAPSPEPGECPLSPANLPELYSPTHEDLAAQEVAAEKEWAARQAALKMQQRQMMMGYMGRPGMMGGYMGHQGPGIQHTSSGSGGIGSAAAHQQDGVLGTRMNMASTGSMPVIMDLRSSAHTPGPGMGSVPQVQDLRSALGGPTPNWRNDTPPPHASMPSMTPMPRITPISQLTHGTPMPPITSLSAAATPMPGPPNGDVAMQDVQQPPINDPEMTEWARPLAGEYPESWDEPDDSFEMFVSETVRYRLGKYVLAPDIHQRIASKDAHGLYKKIRREVVEKERQAYEQRSAQSLFKLIEKRKVEHNLREFVRLSIKRLMTQQAGAS